MKIVYFSPIAFSDLKQRPQYFAEGLSENHQVYFIEPTKRIVSYFINGEDFHGIRYQKNSNLTVFRCDGRFVLPFRWNVYDFLGLNGINEYVQLKKIINKADVIIVGYEGWYNIVKNIKNKIIIYDKMDENTLISTDWQYRNYLRRSEKALIKKSRLMIASAKVFVNKYREQLPVYLVPNAFERTTENYTKYISNSKEKIVYGYVGSIAEWFDNKAVEVIAKNPNHQVILVGPCRNERIEKANVNYVGKVEKRDVAKYINSFDVCLYPFKQGKLLDTINPVKIYEYLSFNKPILAVASEETKEFGADIHIYENYQELDLLCGHNLSQPFESKIQYDLFMEQNSWDKRIEMLNKILEELK